jgi:hypothetical protein
METMPQITIRIMYFLAREAKFERTLAKEHIEDILTDKRINWLTPRDMFKLGGAGTQAIHRSHDLALEPHLEEWQNCTRACFDYRTLKDWGYGRHWEKIFVVEEERPNASPDSSVQELGVQQQQIRDTAGLCDQMLC